MKKLVVTAIAAAAALAGCQPDTTHLEKKIDEINKKLDDCSRRPAAARGAAAAARPAPRAGPREDVRGADRRRPVRRPGRREGQSSRPTTTRARTASASATRWTSSARSTATTSASSTSSSSSTRRSRRPARSRSAPPTSRARPSRWTTLLWDKGFKGRTVRQGPTPAAGAARQPAGVLGERGRVPGRPRLREGARPRRDKFKADMKGECQQLVQKDMKRAAAARRRRDAVVLHQRPLPVGRDADRQLQRGDRRGAEEGERADPEGHAAGQYYEQSVVDKGQKTLQ